MVGVIPRNTDLLSLIKYELWIFGIKNSFYNQSLHLFFSTIKKCFHLYLKILLHVFCIISKVHANLPFEYCCMDISILSYYFSLPAILPCSRFRMRQSCWRGDTTALQAFRPLPEFPWSAMKSSQEWHMPTSCCNSFCLNGNGVRPMHIWKSKKHFRWDICCHLRSFYEYLIKRLHLFLVSSH